MATISGISKVIRVALILVWAAVIVAALTAYLLDPAAFTAAKIAEFLKANAGNIWIAYLLVSALRGLTLLPSTPLVIAGTILFPSEPLAVFLVSLIGIALSSTMIYFFSEALGFDDFFERRKPELVYSLHRKLETPWGLAFVAAWAFFPLAPTDAVCYVAGIVRLEYWKFILAILLGEAVLCGIYIWAGSAMLS
ncbi:MAG: SNARE associated Golgi protein [Acidobacteria bacterium OLB17]|nr:MAG: SNARE associated Golgi protein [Acidobacteria bacterium OLB17]MCZ2391816.1 VTT domain-containing protein [Acidobacteriota bacterium]